MSTTIGSNSHANGIHATRASPHVSGPLVISVDTTVCAAINEMNAQKWVSLGVGTTLTQVAHDAFSCKSRCN